MVSHSQGDGSPTISNGTILFEEGTLLPEPSRLDNGATRNGWVRVANNPVFEKKLAAAGWTFFYMAGTIRANGFGFERQSMIQTALNRLIATTRLQKCNCLEIDRITMRSFWGMPYVSVSAHSRHIQPGSFFLVNARKPIAGTANDTFNRGSVE
jgi:hypothetical protein